MIISSNKMMPICMYVLSVRDLIDSGIASNMLDFWELERGRRGVVCVSEGGCGCESVVGKVSSFISYYLLFFLASLLAF